MCHYTHFSTEERELSRVLKAQGLSIRAIARMLNRSPSSVSREFRRNSYSDGTYAAHYADKLYQKRRKNCGRKPKLKAGAARDYVLEKMALRWSPEQIAGRAKRDKKSFSISFPTIYRAIDNGILPPQQTRLCCCSQASPPFPNLHNTVENRPRSIRLSVPILYSEPQIRK